MKFILRNCQGVLDATIDVPPNSLVEFTGDNSNGKSTISRFIEHLTKGDLHLTEERLPLINDKCESAQFSIISDSGAQLLLALFRETGKSFIAYIPDVNNPKVGVTRYLSDRDGCAKLIHKFGFRTYANGEVCLNLGPTFGPIPLVTTGSKTNYEIFDDFAKDVTAEEFLKSYRDHTRPILRNKVKALKERRNALEKLCQNNLYPDLEFCKSFAEQYSDLATALTLVTYMEPIDYSRPPAYSWVELNPIRYKRPCFFEHPKFIDARTELKNIVEFNNKKCPTCGRLYLEED